jgi:hypothetical protein
VIGDAVGAVVALGTAVGVAVGVDVGVAVGTEVWTDEATGAADVRPAATTAAVPRGPEVTDGRPVARTTPVTRSKQIGTPSPVRTARPTAPRRFGRAISRDFRGNRRIFFTPPAGRDNAAGYEQWAESTLNVLRVGTLPLRQSSRRDVGAREAIMLPSAE